MKRLFGLLILLIAIAGCEYTFNNGSSSTSSGTGTGGTGTGGNPTSPTPTPTPNPSPIPGGGGRTPDPPAGSFLPFPNYTQQAVLSVNVPIGSPCLDFTYLDAVVDALRRQDTRWGYVCGSSCQDVRRDKIAYHGSPGPEVTGALGVWVVDIIADACGPTQRPGFTVGSFDPFLSWSSRGRF